MIKGGRTILHTLLSALGETKHILDYQDPIGKPSVDQ